MPTRQRSYALVHGDYSPKNTLLYRDQLVLLDFEVIHWGDPAFDLGFGLTHLLSKAHHLPTQRTAFAQAANHYWSTYIAELGAISWGEGLEQYAVRHTLACLLARVRGRSPLEYLSEEARNRQAQLVVALMQTPPSTVTELVEEWVRGLEEAN
jgi:5-methylthioribose kinase